MSAPPTPLLELSPERQAQELRRAAARSDNPGRPRFLLLTFICFGWLLVGFVLLGLSFHLTDSDRAQAALLGALLVGNGGPAWTLLLAHWLVHHR